MSDLDILSVDSKIRKKFSDEKAKLSVYTEKLNEIRKSLTITNIRPRVRKSLEQTDKELSEIIYNINNDIGLNFYIVESISLLDEYKKILQAPMKMSFMGKPVKNNKKKQEIVNEYLKIAQKHIDIRVDIPEKKNKILCKNCPNKKNFEISDGNTYICLDCCAQQVILKNVSSYTDIDRINISSKYRYDRKVHFRDGINQYQGKQNSTIVQKVYNDLEDQFEKHHLLVGTKDTPKHIKFKNITKEHISIFLKELEYTKHYENINLIHYNFTEVKPDDIGYLEDKLLDDFDTLTDLYDKRVKPSIERKNFINTQYVLFELLTRHKHPCKLSDFCVLKTMDRKSFHDEICKELFEELGWNHTPIF